MRPGKTCLKNISVSKIKVNVVVLKKHFSSFYRDDGEINEVGDVNDGTQGDSYSPEEGVDSSNTYDMLQMALKIASGELEEPAVDLDTALTTNTIQTPEKSQNDQVVDNNGLSKYFC